MVESQRSDEQVDHVGWGRYLTDLVRQTYDAWRADRVMRLGAGLAYYALFALVPLLAIVIALASLAFSQADVQAALVAPLADALDVDREALADALGSMVEDSTPSSGLGVIGAGSLLLAATLLFVAMQDAFDVIWHVPVEVGIEYTLRRRATALLVIVVMAVLVMALFVLQSAIGLLEAVLPTDRFVLSALTETLTGAGSWALGAATVALVFRILPRTDVSWRAAIIGGAITTTVLALGSSLFGFYLRNFGVRSAEGAAAGVLVLLLWFYAMSQIVLAGAVLTRRIDEHASR